MKSQLLVTGSLAFDRIAVFKGKFSDHILKGHVHNLNVAFNVEEMQIHEGGTGGNIAYNLSLLGEKPILLGTIGNDASSYLAKLKKLKIDVAGFKKVPEELTATATIMTDLADNQITSFYMGAMKKARQAKISAIKKPISMAIISANEPKAMQDYADYCFKKDIPFIADPGQAIHAFSKIELKTFLTGAHAVVCNDYEWEMIRDKTGWDIKKTLDNLNFLIVTFGDKGSAIWSRDGMEAQIKAYKAKKVVDPTGCGDAYRAGLMYGFQHDYSIEASAHIGSWLAAKAVEKVGTQSHKVSKTDFKSFLKRL